MHDQGVELPRKGYWSEPDVLEKHAKRRRDKYATDPDVARAEKARQRKIYRDRLGADFVNHARDGLKGLEDREYSASEISLLLGRAPEYVNRLINRGMWPDPRPCGNTTAQPCFSAAQSRKLLSAFADHVDGVANNYRADHIETKAALFAAMQEG